MTSSIYLCPIDSIADPGSRGFKIDIEGQEEPLDLFVVKKNNRVFAYKNTCPHAYTPLEWIEDQFLTSDKSMIICVSHGALFTIEDGACVSGPCTGQNLSVIAHELTDGNIYISSKPKL